MQRLHAEEGGARASGHATAGGFQVALRLVLQAHGLFDAVLHRAAGVQRHDELQGDVGRQAVAGVRAEAHGLSASADVAADLGVGLGQAAAGGHGGQAAGTGFFGLQPGHVQRQPGLAQRRAGGFGLRHPLLDIGRHDRRQRHRYSQRLGLHALAADQLVQRQALDVEVVLGRQLLRHRQVKACLRLAGVGDGLRADFEVALGRGELLGNRLLGGAHRLQRVGRGQHVEIGLRQPHDQVLLGAHQLGVGDLDGALGLGNRLVIGPVEQRRHGGHTGRGGGAESVQRAGVGRLTGGACGVDDGVERRPLQRPGLLGPENCRFSLQAGRLVDRVIVPRRVVQGLQALRLGAAGQQQQGGQRRTGQAAQGRNGEGHGGRILGWAGWLVV